MAIYAQLSCEMPRDPRMMAAGPTARLVYIEALLYCRENLTDGIIDELTLLFWCPDINAKTRRKHLERLVEVGALEPCDQGWRFPNKVWRKWNPSRAEVDAKRASEAERLRKYRERTKNVRDANEERTDVRDATVQGAYAIGMESHSQSHSHREKPPRVDTHMELSTGQGINNIIRTLDERWTA